MQFSIREKDDSRRLVVVYTSSSSRSSEKGLEAREQVNSELVPTQRRRVDWRHLLNNIFLPAGYPTTVSPDYLQYQIYNALQAFCSSLASLLASRAVLQGHGVGNASASATHAILLTVLQDVFSRLTTIVAGYHLGTSLYPEAKTYRLLADVFNDVAIVLDMLSPHLADVALSVRYPFFSPASDSYLRVVSLCLSGAFRALCGVVAGGSKAALTVHFANGTGDVGDLSAKDGSKETVLALLGMLCGTIVMHYVHSARLTYVVLFTLLFCHLAFNYAAVRAVVMRSLNRQRASLAWRTFRSIPGDQRANNGANPLLTPKAIAAREGIFAEPALLYHPSIPRRLLGRCDIGTPFSSILSGHRSLYFPSQTSSRFLSVPQIHAVIQIFSNEKYVLWYDPELPSSGVTLHIALKDGHGPLDHLKGWAHAIELASRDGGRAPFTFEERVSAVRDTYDQVIKLLPNFIETMRSSGWKLDEGTLVTGSPRTISIDSLPHTSSEDRKNI